MSAEYLIPHKYTLKILCKSKHFPRRYQWKREWVFFSEHIVWCREIFTTALRNSVMNVSSECVDNFHYYNQLELLLLILVCIHVVFHLFREKCGADRSWKFISVGTRKSWKMIFLKELSPCVMVFTFGMCSLAAQCRGQTHIDDSGISVVVYAFPHY